MDTTPPRTIRALTLALVLAIGAAACGKKGGGSSSSGGDFLAVDLATGAVTAEKSPSLTAAKWRTTHVLVRRMPAGTLQPEPSGRPGEQGDELATPAAVSSFYLGVFELTQGQWMRIAGFGDQPWLAASSAGDRLTVESRAATSLAYDDISAALAVWNLAKAAGLGGRALDLPTEAEWEWAARGSSTASFGWGESLDPAVVGRFAACWDTGAGSAQPVGQRSANGYGLFDAHGNAREWTLDPDGAGGGQPVLRGGGWGDNVLRCRSANRIVGVDRAVRHAFSGARLKLIVP